MSHRIRQVPTDASHLITVGANDLAILLSWILFLGTKTLISLGLA
jgi:hypothetical protein